MVAETTTGCLISAEATGEGGTLPEELGKQVSALLLDEVHNGGCIDTVSQSLVLVLMALCPEDVSKVLNHTLAC
jgi:RNA 3'-terminal phosphate cyclase-like protein